MKCPYCDSEIDNNLSLCPHCMAELKPNVKVVQVNTKGFNNIQTVTPLEQEVKQPKKSYTKYFVIIGIMIIILVVLLSLILIKIKPDKVYKEETKKTTTTDIIKKEMTLNKGVFSGREKPVTVGEMTIASIYDESEDVTKLVDVMITRYLTDGEVLDIVTNNNYSLNEGFTYVGVEYNVYFHDLGYLGTKTLNPILKVSILESNFFNDFFLVNGHYYKIDVISLYNGPNITNEESATIKLVYQVPIDKNHYICFGSDTSSLGCYRG